MECEGPNDIISCQGLGEAKVALLLHLICVNTEKSHCTATVCKVCVCLCGKAYAFALRTDQATLV